MTSESILKTTSALTPSVVGSKPVLRYLPVALRHQGLEVAASLLIALMVNQVVALRLVSIVAAYFEGVQECILSWSFTVIDFNQRKMGRPHLSLPIKR